MNEVSNSAIKKTLFQVVEADLCHVTSPRVTGTICLVDSQFKSRDKTWNSIT